MSATIRRSGYGFGNFDIIYGSGTNFELWGGTGDDTLRVYPGDSGRLEGGDGNDVLKQYGISGIAAGGLGNDVIESGSDVTVFGGAGNDKIFDTLTANVAEQLVDAGSGGDFRGRSTDIQTRSRYATEGSHHRRGDDRRRRAGGESGDQHHAGQAIRHHHGSHDQLQGAPQEQSR